MVRWRRGIFPGYLVSRDFVPVSVRLTLVVLLWGCAVPAIAAEYSADIVESSPQGIISLSKLYVSGENSRRETGRRGQQIVEISAAGTGEVWTLFPSEHTYLVRAVGQGATMSENPCSGRSDIRCMKLGTLELDGREVDHWEVVSRDGAGRGRHQYWMDTERGIPLRLESADGTRSAWHLEGMDRIEGRHVEKWRISEEQPGRASTFYFRWMDPELNIPVREELPGGFVRKVHNIRVGPQPEHLFSIPVGYRRISSSWPP